MEIQQQSLPGFAPHRGHLLIREMPAPYQPRERLTQEGAERLSTGELLSVLIDAREVGEAERLLAYFGSFQRMAQASLEECHNAGLSKVRALRLKAALELHNRCATADTASTITSPADAAAIFMPLMADKEQEYFMLLLLNTKHKVLRSPINLYVGTIDTINIRIADVLREVVRHNAAAFIIAHNHPSGHPEPSREDVRIMKDIKKAGDLIHAELLDAFVIGHSRWVSLKERGLLS